MREVLDHLITQALYVNLFRLLLARAGPGLGAQRLLLHHLHVRRRRAVLIVRALRGVKFRELFDVAVFLLIDVIFELFHNVVFLRRHVSNGLLRLSVLTGLPRLPDRFDATGAHVRRVELLLDLLVLHLVYVGLAAALLLVSFHFLLLRLNIIRNAGVRFLVNLTAHLRSLGH